MRNRIITICAACCAALDCIVRAEQGGSGHYTLGTYTDFSSFPPTQPGWYFANDFLDYQNATCNGSGGKPRDGLIALGVTANLQAVSPIVLYAFPFTGKLNTLTIKIEQPQLSPEDIKKLKEGETRATDNR